MVDTLKELSDLSRQLNQQSDKVNSIISKVNELLASLNLGVEVWLTDDPIETGGFTEFETEPNWHEECLEATILGYCRVSGSWELAVKNMLLPCMVVDEEHEESEPVQRGRPISLLKAGRNIRVKAVSSLPKLLEVIKQEGQELLASIEKAEAAAEELSKLIPERPHRRRKFEPGARVRGKEEGPASFRGRTGTVVEYGGDSQYWVQFDDGRKECVPSSWIEPL